MLLRVFSCLRYSSPSQEWGVPFQIPSPRTGFPPGFPPGFPFPGLELRIHRCHQRLGSSASPRFNARMVQCEAGIALLDPHPLEEHPQENGKIHDPGSANFRCFPQSGSNKGKTTRRCWYFWMSSRMSTPFKFPWIHSLGGQLISPQVALIAYFLWPLNIEGSIWWTATRCGAGHSVCFQFGQIWELRMSQNSSPKIDDHRFSKDMFWQPG